MATIALTDVLTGNRFSLDDSAEVAVAWLHAGPSHVLMAGKRVSKEEALLGMVPGDAKEVLGGVDLHFALTEEYSSQVHSIVRLRDIGAAHPCYVETKDKLTDAANRQANNKPLWRLCVVAGKDPSVVAALQQESEVSWRSKPARKVRLHLAATKPDDLFPERRRADSSRYVEEDGDTLVALVPHHELFMYEGIGTTARIVPLDTPSHVVAVGSIGSAVTYVAKLGKIEVAWHAHGFLVPGLADDPNVWTYCWDAEQARLNDHVGFAKARPA